MSASLLVYAETTCHVSQPHANRWNPDSQEAPKYASYQVDINNCGPMMLDVLLKIKDEQDQTLSIRRSCR